MREATYGTQCTNVSQVDIVGGMKEGKEKRGITFEHFLICCFAQTARILDTRILDTRMLFARMASAYKNVHHILCGKKARQTMFRASEREFEYGRLHEEIMGNVDKIS